MIKSSKPTIVFVIVLSDKVIVPVRIKKIIGITEKPKMMIA
jgi:hypothetical protein